MPSEYGDEWSGAGAKQWNVKNGFFAIPHIGGFLIMIQVVDLFKLQ